MEAVAGRAVDVVLHFIGSVSRNGAPAVELTYSLSIIIGKLLLGTSWEKMRLPFFYRLSDDMVYRVLDRRECVNCVTNCMCRILVRPPKQGPRLTDDARKKGWYDDVVRNDECVKAVLRRYLLYIIAPSHFTSRVPHIVNLVFATNDVGLLDCLLSVVDIIPAMAVLDLVQRWMVDVHGRPKYGKDAWKYVARPAWVEAHCQTMMDCGKLHLTRAQDKRLRYWVGVVKRWETEDLARLTDMHARN